MDARLQWCRENAPSAFKDLSDEELINYMNSAYERFVAKDKNRITVYHGTPKANFVPDYNFHNPTNDYGCGLYTTCDVELAKEWAMSKYNKKQLGYVYGYTLNLEGLKVLNLDELDTLYWLATLISNRPVDNLYGLTVKRLEKLKKRYCIDLSGYDIIKGYRADDSYFSYVRDFLSNTISLEQLEHALRFGNLGIQYCIKSELAYSRLDKVFETTVSLEYRDKFNERDLKARQDYFNTRNLDTPTETSLETILRREGL